MTDPHAQTAAAEEETDAAPPSHLRPIASFFKWFGILLALAAAGFFVVRTLLQGFDVVGGFALFATIYGMSIWHANALTLERFDD